MQSDEMAMIKLGSKKPNQWETPDASEDESQPDKNQNEEKIEI